MDPIQLPQELTDLVGKLSRKCFNFYDPEVDQLLVDAGEITETSPITIIVQSKIEKNFLSASAWLSVLLTTKKVRHRQESINSFVVFEYRNFIDSFKPYQDPAPQTSLTSNPETL